MGTWISCHPLAGGARPPDNRCLIPCPGALSCEFGAVVRSRAGSHPDHILLGSKAISGPDSIDALCG